MSGGVTETQAMDAAKFWYDYKASSQVSPTRSLPNE
jgi:hypothetical protein